MPLIQVDTPLLGAAIVRLFLTILVIISSAVVYFQSITMEMQNVFVFLIRGILSHNCDSFETKHIWDIEFWWTVYLAGALAMHEVIGERVDFKLVIL